MKIDIKRLTEQVYKRLFENRIKDLLQKYPDLSVAYESGITNYHYLLWLIKALKGEPIEDAVDVLLVFEKNKQRLKAKGANTNLSNYGSVSELRQTLEDVLANKTRRQLKDEEVTKLGQYGEWIVAMPHTREASCQLGVGTQWCTAATQSQNLFWNYIGRSEANVILYYVIRKGVDSREDPMAKVSVGFVNGKAILSGQDGHVTVDALNRGLTERDLRSIWGEEYDAIMGAMTRHSGGVGGEHPGKKELKRAAVDVAYLEKMLDRLEKEERADLLKIIMKYDMSEEVLTFLSGDDIEAVRSAIARHPNTPEAALVELSIDPSFSVRFALAIRENMPEAALEILSEDDSVTIRSHLATNKSIPISIFEKLSKDEDSDVRSAVATAANKNTPAAVLAELSKDEEVNVRKALAYNINIPVSVLVELSKDEHVNVRETVAGNPNTPVSVLVELSKDEDWVVRWAVAWNPNTPVPVLEKLREDKNHKVRDAASRALKRLKEKGEIKERYKRYIREFIYN